MIEQRGRVIAATDQEIWVDGMPESACGSCSLKAGCGQRLLSGRTRRVRVRNELGAQVDDEVVIGIPKDILVKASILLYLIPMLVMLLMAVLTHRFLSAQDGWVLVAAAAGLGLGLAVAWRLAAAHRVRAVMRPRLLRRVAPARSWMPREAEGHARER